MLVSFFSFYFVPLKDKWRSGCTKHLKRFLHGPHKGQRHTPWYTWQALMLARCRTSSCARKSVVLRKLQSNFSFPLAFSSSLWPQRRTASCCEALQPCKRLISEPKNTELVFGFFYYSQSCAQFGLNLSSLTENSRPQPLMIGPAAEVAACLLMDNELASSSGFNLNNLIQRPCVLCLFS